MKQSPVVMEYPNSSASKSFVQIMGRLSDGSTQTGIAKGKRGIGNFFNNVLKHNNRF